MRLINADYLLGLVNAKLEEDWSVLPRKFLFGVRDLLNATPTIDAVEVVWCRDCKHWVRDGNESFGYAMFCKANCSLGGQGIKKPNDFCSYGERK